MQQGRKQPFSEIDRYLGSYPAEPATKRTNRGAIRQFRGYCEERGTAAEPLLEDAAGWKAALDARYKPQSVNRKLVALASYFAWLEDEGAYPNIFAGVPRNPQTPPRTRKALEPRQVEALMASVEECGTRKEYRDRAIPHTLLTTGISSSQLRKAKVRDLVTEGGETLLRVRSGGRESLVPVGQKLHGYIEEYLRKRRGKHGYRPDSPLFAIVKVSAGKDPNSMIQSEQLSTALDRMMAKAGIEGRVGDYSFQFTAMRLALMGGATLREVQELAMRTSLPTRYVLALEDEWLEGDACRGVKAALSALDSAARRGTVKCRDLRLALSRFDDNDLIEVAIDEEGDLKVSRISRISSVTVGVTDWHTLFQD